MAEGSRAKCRIASSIGYAKLLAEGTWVLQSGYDFQSRSADDAASAFDILQWMDAAAIKDFNRLARKRSFNAGQVVYTQQEPGTEMFRIVDGSVRLTARADDGREIVFLLFGAGDCFGSSSLVDQEPRPQSAECLKTTELQVLDHSGFEAMLAKHDTFATAIMRLLSRQMRVASQNFVRSSLTSLASRVAIRIIELSVSRADPTEPRILAVELPQSELAALAGGSRQSVNKILQDFQRQGILHLSSRTIVVDDLDALRRQIEPVSNLGQSP